MQIREIVVLDGPNIWTNNPALEAIVDLGKYEDLPSNLLPGFAERIMQWLPTMVEHRCGVGVHGGFFLRLREGTWLGHVLEHVTLELQTLAHLPIGFGRARETAERGVYHVVIGCHESRFARACLEVGRELVLAAAESREFDLTREIARLRELADRWCLGPSTQAIVAAARERSIPVIRMTAGNLIQLGYGKRQRRAWTAETDTTGAIAEGIAQDKQLTRQLLSAVGVPVPDGRVVSDADDAWAAAVDIGLPVVVKPVDANHGRGVSIRLSDQAAIQTAYEYAAREGSGVIVERFVAGRQHRVLVVGERAIAAASGDVEHVVGDGVRSVEELVAIANQDPARGEGSALLLTTLVIDEIALQLLRHQELTPKSVPVAGREVVLHYNGDFTRDVTDRVHPDVAAHAVLAAQTVGLDIAGIDVIAEDVSRPLEPQAGAVIEVNASPGLVMHLKPMSGKPRPVGEAIVGHLFPGSEDGRIPIVAVSGGPERSALVSRIERLLATTGRTVACVSRESVKVGGREIAGAAPRSFERMQNVLVNPFVEAVVTEVDCASVLDSGLAFDGCDLAVVTGVPYDERPTRPFREPRVAIEKAVRAPVDVVLPRGIAVLDADDPVILEMAGHSEGAVLLYSRTKDSPAIRDHVGSGGSAVISDGDQVVLLQGQSTTVIGEIGQPSGGDLAFHATVAALRALGLIARRSSRPPADADRAEWG